MSRHRTIKGMTVLVMASERASERTHFAASPATMSASNCALNCTRYASCSARSASSAVSFSFHAPASRASSSASAAACSAAAFDSACFSSAAASCRTVLSSFSARRSAVDASSSSLVRDSSFSFASSRSC